MKSFGIAAAACALVLCTELPALAQEQTQLQLLDELQPPATLDPGTPERRTTRRATSQGYFIEFRSRSALSYGHTFVVFGRVGEKLTTKNVAGLHPRGDSSFTYVLGHILMVPAETGASDGDLEEQYMTARYRIMLTAVEYREIVGHIRELQANSPTWHAVTYNCNAFAGTIAHFVGLVSPPTWLLPEDFVNSMRQMNDGRTRPALPRPDVADAGRAMARHIPARR